MPFSGAQATASVEAAKYLVENAPRRIQIHGHLPVKGVAGGFLSYARAHTSLIPATVVDACGIAPDDSDEATATQFGFVDYATRVQICNADQDVFRHPNLLDEVEIILAEIKCEYGYYKRMDEVTGDPATGGLRDLISSARMVDGGGAALSFPCLSQAFHLVTANSGRPTALMSNARSLESYENLCRGAGFDVPMVPWRWYCPAQRKWKDDFVASFNGVPWLINDLMDNSGEPENTRIYFMVLGDDDGPGPTRGLTRIVPQDMVGNPFVLRVTNGVPNFDDMTVRMTKDIWLSMPAGLALGSQGALSMLFNFDHVGSCSVG